MSARRCGVRKIFNEYAREFPRYSDAPKAVIAAVAFSLAMRLCGDDPESARNLILKEWAALHKAGIVPQAAKREASK